MPPFMTFFDISEIQSYGLLNHEKQQKIICLYLRLAEREIFFGGLMVTPMPPFGTLSAPLALSAINSPLRCPIRDLYTPN